MGVGVGVDPHLVCQLGPQNSTDAQHDPLLDLPFPLAFLLLGLPIVQSWVNMSPGMYHNSPRTARFLFSLFFFVLSFFVVLQVRGIGEVYAAVPLAAFALVDPFGFRVSWKVVGIASDDPSGFHDITDENVAATVHTLLECIKDWLRTGRHCRGEY